MFEWLLHAGTRKTMLKMFLKDVSKPLYGLEIAQVLKTSPGTIHRELNAMLSQGILSKKRVGALIMYRLNTDHPYFHELKKALNPKKRSDRVLLMSGLGLSLKVDQNIEEDFRIFLEYAEENASELVLLGDMIASHDLFSAYLTHKSLLDRVGLLSLEIPVTIVPGHSDRTLVALSGEKLLNSGLRFSSRYHSQAMGITAVYHSVKQLDSESSYHVIGGPHPASVKESGHFVQFTTGSWIHGKRCFVEIDQDGGALVNIQDLR